MNLFIYTSYIILRNNVILYVELFLLLLIWFSFCQLNITHIENTKYYKTKIFNDLIKLLNSNSINRNLKKGYVLLSKSKKILKNSNQIKNNDFINIKFYDKTIGVNIKKVN